MQSDRGQFQEESNQGTGAETGAAQLTQAERRTMLEEIGRVALAVGRSLYTEEGSLEIASSYTPGLLSGREQIAFLRTHLPTIERTFAMLAQAPPFALRSEVVLRSPERVRHPRPQAVLEAIRRGDFRETEPSETGPRTPWLAQRLGGRMPRVLADAVPAVSYDTPFNRWLVGRLSAWRRDLRAIAALAEWEGEEPLREEARALEARFRALAQAEYLAECPVSESAQLPEAALRDRRCRPLCDLVRRYRRLFAYVWDAASLLLPPREAWLLYEVWCYFQMVAALREAGWQPVGGDAVLLSDSRLSVALTKGQASRLLFRRPGSPPLALYYNRAFASANVGSREIASRTHTMIPDICLEHGDRLFLLDAKFRTYAQPRAEQTDLNKIIVTDKKSVHKSPALLDDLNKMHAYRDAIVKDGERVVEQAWCLFPGQAEGEEKIIAFPTSTTDQPFGIAGVGAMKLRPGQADQPLVKLIVEWMAA